MRQVVNDLIHLIQSRTKCERLESQAVLGLVLMSFLREESNRKLSQSNLRRLLSLVRLRGGSGDAA